MRPSERTSPQGLIQPLPGLISPGRQWSEPGRGPRGRHIGRFLLSSMCRPSRPWQELSIQFPVVYTTGSSCVGTTCLSRFSRRRGRGLSGLAIVIASSRGTLVTSVCNLPNAQVRKVGRLNLAKTGRLQTCPTFDGPKPERRKPNATQFAEPDNGRHALACGSLGKTDEPRAIALRLIRDLWQTEWHWACALPLKVARESANHWIGWLMPTVPSPPGVASPRLSPD